MAYAPNQCHLSLDGTLFYTLQRIYANFCYYENAGLVDQAPEEAVLTNRVESTHWSLVEFLGFGFCFIVALLL